MFDDSMDEAFIIRQANEIKDFVSVFKLQDQAGTTSQVIYSSSLSLNNTQKAAIFGILQSNMQLIYEATSWGWDESQKRKELFAQNSRFLLLVEPDNSDNIKAFVMFRFEWDDEDEPEHPVLFCYELQVQSACHKQGLGKTLMKMLQSIAEHCRFWKTMLTCFKINENALRFYRAVGFDVDLNSPSCYGHHDEPYEILSDKPKLR